VAVTGKFVGSAVAAKVVGQSWHDSFAIGALMNTRGLMELVVLNIGYDLGVLSPKAFAMMVIMALITTFMTGPALHLIQKIFQPKTKEKTSVAEVVRKFNVLISFAHPERGASLLRLAYGLIHKQNDRSTITVMHLSPNNDLNHFNAAEYEKESFASVLQQSEQLDIPIVTLFKASNDIDNEIATVANAGNYDLLLIGIGQSIFEGSILGKILGFTARIINPDRLINKVKGREKLFENSPFDEKTRLIVSKSDIPVGVFVDKNFTQAQRIVLVAFSNDDWFLLSFAQRFKENSGSKIIVVPVGGLIRSEKLNGAVHEIGQIGHEQELNRLLPEQDILLITTAGWKSCLDKEYDWLKNIPSTLIINP
jgi:hypothetical protein